MRIDYHPLDKIVDFAVSALSEMRHLETKEDRTTGSSLLLISYCSQYVVETEEDRKQELARQRWAAFCTVPPDQALNDSSSKRTAYFC